MTRTWVLGFDMVEGVRDVEWAGDEGSWKMLRSEEMKH